MTDKKGKKTLIILGIVLVISIITTLLIIIQVPYSDVEHYTEQEPYTDDVCENVQLKAVIEWEQGNSICINEICDRTEQYCVEKNFWGNCIEFRDRCIHYACTKYKRYCNLEIQNIGDTAGTWKFDGYSLNKDTSNKKFVDSVSVYVKPTRTGVGSWSFNYDAGENMGCTYKDIITPTKRVCENVIKYRTTQKSRTVTKYCNLWKRVIERC